jgi:hypothetical protein
MKGVRAGAQADRPVWVRRSVVAGDVRRGPQVRSTLRGLGAVVLTPDRLVIGITVVCLRPSSPGERRPTCRAWGPPVIHLLADQA